MKYLKFFENIQPKYSIKLENIEAYFTSKRKEWKGVIPDYYAEYGYNLDWDAETLITIFLRNTLLKKAISINRLGSVRFKKVERINVMLKNSKYEFLIDDERHFLLSHDTIHIYDEISDDSKIVLDEIKKMNTAKQFDL